MIRAARLPGVRRASIAQIGSFLAVLGAALFVGAIIGMELIPALWVSGGVIGLLFLVWVSAVMPVETVILWVIGSVVLQNYLTPNLAFWIYPVYVLSLILLCRLWADRRFHRVPAPMDGPIRAWLIVAALSVPVAFYVGPALPGGLSGLRYTALRPIFQYFALLLSVIPYYALVSPLSARRDLYAKALRTFLAVGTGVAVLALYEQAAYYLGLPKLPLQAGLNSKTSSFSIAGSVVYRSKATFLEPLTLGLFLLGTTALTMSLLAGERPGLGEPRRRRRLWFAMIVQTAALVATFSGGAYAGFIIVCLSLLLVVRSRARALLLVLSVAAGILGSAFVLARVIGVEHPLEILTARPLATLAFEEATAGSSSAPGYEYSRGPYRRASLELLRRYPFTGVGIGNFGAGALMVDPHVRADAGSYGVLWGLIGEYGIPGAILFVYLVGTFLMAVGRAYRRHPTEAPELAGFFAGFVGMLVQFFTYGYSRLDPMVWVFIAMAMAGVLLARSGGRGESA